MPEWSSERSKDFFLFPTDDPERAAELVIEIVQERIPRKFGIPSNDVQVLSPMHRGEVGVTALNEKLQEALNPPSPQKPERRLGSRVYRQGDRVMQIRNNYDKDVFNGDQGQVVSLDPIEQLLAVRIDDRVVPYDFLELDELGPLAVDALPRHGQVLIGGFNHELVARRRHTEQQHEENGFSKAAGHSHTPVAENP